MRSHVQDGLLHLDRDDYGTSNDRVVGPDGEPIEFEYNEEIVTIRGIVPGEYTLNLHLFQYIGKFHPTDGVDGLIHINVDPVEVTVEITNHCPFE